MAKRIKRICMKDRKLLIFDIDETLLDWEFYYTIGTPNAIFNGVGVTTDTHLRPYAVELLQKLQKTHDIGLFSTAIRNHVLHTASRIEGVEFKFLYGYEKVTRLDGAKVKDIQIFTDHGYEIDNIVLIDDKPRNARLHPENFIFARNPNYYKKRHTFDEECYRLERCIDSHFKSRL